MKVIGIRGNYQAGEGRAAENHACQSVYLIGDSSLLFNRRPFFVPDFAESFVASPTVVARVSRLGKDIARKFAPRYYDALTVGMTVKAVGMRGDFADGGPGALAETFDNSAILGDFIPVEQVDMPARYEVQVDGATAGVYSTSNLVAGIDQLVESLSRYYTLKTGDLLYASTPEPCLTMRINSVLTATLNGTEVLHMRVK